MLKGGGGDNGTLFPTTTSFWSSSSNGSCIKCYPKKWAAMAFADAARIGTTSAAFHLRGPIFVTELRRLWGLGCWVTWREPGCDSFATALSGCLVLARIVQLKLRHEPWPTGSRLTRQKDGAACQRAKPNGHPLASLILLDARQCQAVCGGHGMYASGGGGG